MVDTPVWTAPYGFDPIDSFPRGYEQCVALVITLLTVMATLGAIAMLLWLSAAFETNQLGPFGAGAPAVVPPESRPIAGTAEAA